MFSAPTHRPTVPVRTSQKHVWRPPEATVSSHRLQVTVCGLQVCCDMSSHWTAQLCTYVQRQAQICYYGCSSMLEQHLWGLDEEYRVIQSDEYQKMGHRPHLCITGHLHSGTGTIALFLFNSSIFFWLHFILVALSRQ